MREYLSEAIVLDRLPNGNLDERIIFFTKRFGRLTGKATSVRKITSKLSGHLQPGNLVQMRLVEKNGLQVADALKKTRVDLTPPELRFLGSILSEAEPEFLVWEMLFNGRFSWREALKILGWDPNFASCAVCDGTAGVFQSRSQEFFCNTCASKLHKDEVICLDS